MTNPTNTSSTTDDSVIQAALHRLPHGPEFRFLDRLLSLDPGQQGRAEYLVRGDEPFLRGHFPSQPLFPGVLLIEAAAQLAGVVAQSDPLIPPLQQLRLTAVHSAKILGSARPGERIEFQARVSGRLGNLVQADVTATIFGRQILHATLTLSGEQGVEATE